jgi:hypothetical protein
VKRRAFLAALVAAAAVPLAGCYAELDWRELYWPEGKVKVMLPARPGKSAREVTLAGEKVNMEMLQSQLRGMAFGVAWSAVPAAEPAAVLAAARDTLIKNIEGRLLTDREVQVPGASSPGREFTGEGVVAGTPMAVAGRVVIANGRFYQAVFVGRKDRLGEVDLPLFLGSLTVVP